MGGWRLVQGEVAYTSEVRFQSTPPLSSLILSVTVRRAVARPGSSMEPTGTQSVVGWHPYEEAGWGHPQRDSLDRRNNHISTVVVTAVWGFSEEYN